MSMESWQYGLRLFLKQPGAILLSVTEAAITWAIILRLDEGSG
jgi:hypothetical protein